MILHRPNPLIHTVYISVQKLICQNYDLEMWDEIWEETWRKMCAKIYLEEHRLQILKKLGWNLYCSDCSAVCKAFVKFDKNWKFSCSFCFLQTKHHRNFTNTLQNIMKYHGKSLFQCSCFRICMWCLAAGRQVSGGSVVSSQMHLFALICTLYLWSLPNYMCTPTQSLMHLFAHFVQLFAHFIYGHSQTTCVHLLTP